MKQQRNFTTSEVLSTDEWHSVIKDGFRAEVLSHSANPSLYYSIFRKGPFRIALLNFPTGLMCADMWTRTLQESLINELQANGVHLLRVSYPNQGNDLETDDVLLPVTQIHKLQDWSLQHLAQDIRYKIRKSQRMGLSIRTGQPNDDKSIFQMYCNAVKRNSGNLRYTPLYFKKILQMAEQQDKIQILIAETPLDEACGFIIVAHDGYFCHYLHGGFSDQHASLRPGYLLMAQAIESAKTKGAQIFDLMASPKHQHQLIRFKEKWGGVTHLQRTITIPLGFKGHILKFLLKQHNRIFT